MATRGRIQYDYNNQTVDHWDLHSYTVSILFATLKGMLDLHKSLSKAHWKAGNSVILILDRSCAYISNN